MRTINPKILTIFFLFISLQLSAQEDWVSYVKAIPISGYEEKKFRIKAFVRTVIEDEDAGARLWARVDKADGKAGFFENNWNTPIRSEEWKVYTLEGVIDKGAAKLSFGVLLQFNGKFFFDDIQVEVETKKDKWLSLYKADFESGNLDLTPGIKEEQPLPNATFTAAFTKENVKVGKQSLVITGNGVPNYGTNSKVGKYAHVNGIKLYYEIYGSGPPLLVLHGNGGSISNATPHYRELIKNYKVIAVDSRAQGKSTDTEAPLTYEQMAADLNALLEEIHTDSVFIWGQSDGAILGLILAMDYPKKVKRVLAYGSNVQPDTSALFSWSIESARKMTEEADPKRKKLGQLMIDYPKIPYARLSSIKAPVMIMAGDRDAIRPEHSVKIFQHIPNSQLCILPGATHGGSWEKQQLFLQLLNDFFLKPFHMPDTKDWY